MKKLLILFLVLGLQFQVFAQLDPYQWRLGISGGFSNYYGDLSPYPISSLRDYSDFIRLFEYNDNYIQDKSFAASLERKLTPTIGLLFLTGKYTISMSDRYVNKQNSLQMDVPNFDRALNFKTEIRDYGMGLVFRTDNGKILNPHSFIAPYLTLGAGWLNFKVYGDLYGEDGNPYNYAASDPNNDRVFESRLDGLATELEGGYSDHAFYGQLGLGVRFRLANQLELFLQSDFKHTATDYLEDVSGQYRVQYDSPGQAYAAKPGTNPVDWENPIRGNSNGKNDWYVYHHIGLKFSFSPSKTSYRASRVSPGIFRSSEVVPEAPLPPLSPTDSLPLVEKETGITNNYITFIQLNQPFNRDSSYYSFKVLESDVSIIKWERKSVSNKALIDSLGLRLDSLQSIREQIMLSPLIASEDSVQRLSIIKESTERVNTRLSEALLNANQIEEELESSVQNKALYQAAYNMSLGSQVQRDSLTFMNEILELPAEITKALAQTGSINSSQYDRPNTFLWTSPFTKDSLPDTAANSFLPSPETLDLGNQQSQINQVRSELMQERAKTNFLLRELGNYSENQSFQSFSQRVATNDEYLKLYEEENQESPIYYVNPNNTQRPYVPPGNNRGQEYIFPVIVPGNGSRTVLPPGQMDPKGSLPSGISGGITDINSKIPPAKETIGDIPDLSISGIPYGYADVKSKTKQPLAVSRVRVDTVYLEKKTDEILINNKVEIYFDTNQAKPNEKELQKLFPIATSLTNNLSWIVNISGFSDNTGNLSYNLALIEQRVDYIRNFFVEERGISPDRLFISSGGLIVRGKGPKSSSPDRKVEVWVQESK